MNEQVYVCPTCKSWRYLEVYSPDSCYCRRCEEGCVKPALISEEDAKKQFPIAQQDRATVS